MLCIAAETGLVGLTAFLYLIWTVIKEGLSAIKNTKQNGTWHCIAIGTLFSFMAVFIHLALGIATLSFSYFWFLIAGIVIISNHLGDQLVAVDLKE